MYENKDEMIDNLDLLTHEADMLSSVMNAALQSRAEESDVCDICYLSEIICKKLEEIRTIF